MLSITIPARNEAENLENIPNYFVNGLNNIEYEVLLINDYSIDNTLEKAEDVFRQHNNFKVFNNKKKD